MSVTYPENSLQDRVAFQQNGKPGVYPVQAWNDEIGTFQFASSLEHGYLIKAGEAVVKSVGADGVRLPQAGDAYAAGQAAAAVAAKGTLTFTANPSATETVKLGNTTYKFVAELAAADDVKLGATVAETVGNLVAAINAGEGTGEKYGTGTAANASVHAVQSEDAVITVFADNEGAAGNSIAMVSTADSITLSGSTLAGGADAGDAAGANAVFIGVAAFSYYITTQTNGYCKQGLDVNVPVKQKGYINVLMSSMAGAVFGAKLAIDLANPGKFKVAGASDVVVGKINKVFPDYGTCEMEIKEFI